MADDLENDVTDYLVLSAQSTTPNVGIDRNYHYISSDAIKLLHYESYTNRTCSIHLHTLPQRVLEAQLNVSFKNCTAGLQLRGEHCTFVNDYGNYLRFNSTSGYAEILGGYWIGLQSDGNEVVSYCLYCDGFSNSNPSSGGYIPLTFTTTENSDLQGRGNKFAACCFQFEVKEALRNTLGSFLLLSSTSLLIVIVQLMNPTFLYSSDYEFAGAVFYLDPGSPFDAGHFYFLFPLFVILFVLVPFLLFLICCRYRPDKLNAMQGRVVVDHILEPLQSHFKRYDLETKEPCIEVKENPQIDDDDLDDEREGNSKKKEQYKECPFKFSFGWFRFPACCSGRVYISYKDFHWVPAGFIILRVILIVMYNYSWNYSIRCMMQLVAVMVTAALIVIYRPYKSDWINTLDSLIFLDLGLLIALSNYQFHLTEVNHTLSVWVYVVQLILIFIPFLWIILYMGARVFGHMNDRWKFPCLVTRNEHARVNEGENSEERVLINRAQLDVRIPINTNL